MKRLLFLIPVAFFAALAALFYFGLHAGPPSVLPSPLVGKPAPDFQMTALDGDAPAFIHSELAQGHPTIVNFWASWCVPCRLEAPELDALAAKNGVPLYGVAYKDDAAKARAFLQELGNPFAKIDKDNSGRVGIDWGVTGVPETFVIDGKGIIQAHYSGPLTDDVIRDVILPATRK